MSGLLLGVMLARAFSSLVAAQWGWRSVYFIAAAVSLLVSVVIARVVPQRPPADSASYPRLLASVARLLSSEPALRRRAICHAVMFSVFSIYWTAVAFELIGAHGFSQRRIALFALVGVTGAAIAPVAGRIGDRGYGRLGSGIAICLASAAMILAGAGSSSVILLGLAGILVDLAAQTHQLLSQQEIYALRPDARARIGTAFMTIVFIGGAIASALTGVIYRSWGWTGVTTFGALLPLLALAAWASGSVGHRG
jgi:predicted MFS family arabinose efflux permease